MRLVISCVVLAMCLSIGFGEDTNWRGAPDVTGDWFNADNWSNGVPTDEDNAYIDNGGTAVIGSGYAESKDLFVGFHGSGIINQESGSLTLDKYLKIGGYDGSDGTYILTNGNLNSMYVNVGSKFGNGTFIHSGGTTAIRGLNLGVYFMMGHPQYEDENIGSARYIQTGGVNNVHSLQLARNAIPNSNVKNSYELIGGEVNSTFQNLRGNVSFRQIGGLNNVNHLWIEDKATYELLGGKLDVSQGIQIDGILDFGERNVTLSAENVIFNFAKGQINNSSKASLQLGENSLLILPEGFDPSANFGEYSNEGMTHVVGNDLVIPAKKTIDGAGGIDDFVVCHGKLLGGQTNLLGIHLTRGIFVHEGAFVDLNDGLIRVNGTGSGMSGGYLTSRGLLVGNTIPDIGETPYAGEFRQSGGLMRLAGLQVRYGTYYLSGGEIKTWHSYVGGRTGHAGQSHIIQTGGVHEVGNLLKIEWQGSYTLLGGTLKAAGLELDTLPYCSGQSRLAILNSDSNITLGRRLFFGERSEFIAAKGSKIHFNGGRLFEYKNQPDKWGFDIRSTDPAAMSGLGNLTLVFEGGDDYVATLEVAGENRGVGYGGYFENFALDTLQVGGAEGSAHVQLTDLFDNQSDWLGDEVLYVKNLILEEGSTLDLNGLKIFCLNFSYEGTLEYGGGVIEESIGEPGGITRIWCDLGPGSNPFVPALMHIISAGDYASVQANFGNAGEPGIAGDFNGDGVVSAADYAYVQSHIGQGVIMLADSQPVPEPTTIFVMACGLATLLRRRRRDI